MTIKKAKPTNPKIIGMTEQEILAQEVGNLVGQRDTINATMDIKCKQINKLRKGKPIGTQASDCAVMKRFLESQVARGLSDNTIKNNCTTFRKAVNEGKPYDVNASRKAIKARGAKVTKANESKPIVKLSIVKDSPAESVSQGLRQAVEQYREQYAELVAFVIDALDEFDGE